MFNSDRFEILLANYSSSERYWFICFSQAARVTHPAYPLEDGFAFVALSGDTITVKVIGTDYSNYSIVTYNFGGKLPHGVENM